MWGYADLFAVRRMICACLDSVLLICGLTTGCEEERGMWSFANLFVAKRSRVPGVGYKEPVDLKFS